MTIQIRHSAHATSSSGDRITVMDAQELWHVTVTVGGPARPQRDVRAAMHRLLDEHPFLLTCRYSTESAEVSYWDQGSDLEDPASIALRLWSEHRASADLPPWRVVGLEVVDRTTYRRRGAAGEAAPAVESMCKVLPF